MTIEVDALVKHFRVHRRGSGVGASLRGLGRLTSGQLGSGIVFFTFQRYFVRGASERLSRADSSVYALP